MDAWRAGRHAPRIPYNFGFQGISRVGKSPTHEFQYWHSNRLKFQPYLDEMQYLLWLEATIPFDGNDTSTAHQRKSWRDAIRQLSYHWEQEEHLLSQFE